MESLISIERNRREKEERERGGRRRGEGGGEEREGITKRRGKGLLRGGVV